MHTLAGTITSTFNLLEQQSDLHAMANIIILRSGKTGSKVGNTIPLRNSPETNKQVWLVLHTWLKGKPPSGDKKGGAAEFLHETEVN